MLAIDGRIEELRKMRKSRGLLFGAITLLATIICIYADYPALALLFGVFAIFHFLEAYDPDLVLSCDTFIKLYGGRKHCRIGNDDKFKRTDGG